MQKMICDVKNATDQKEGQIVGYCRWMNQKSVWKHVSKQLYIRTIIIFALLATHNVKV